MTRALVAVLLAAALAVGGAGAATPRSGGTVVVAWPGVGEPGCIAGCGQNMFFASTHESDLVLAQALREVPSGFASDLVSRTSITRGPFAVTFHIRPEARWSDGRPITAADFVLFHRLYLRNSPDPPTHFWKRHIRRLVAAGPKTLRIELHAPVAWRAGLAGLMPLPSHLLRLDLGPEDAWRDGIVNPRTGRRIGSGPFLLQRWQPGRELVLVRNPRYWEPRPARLDRLVFRLGLGDPVAALRRGEVHVVGGAAQVIQSALAELRRRPAPGLRVVAVPGTGWEHLDLRLGPGGHRALRHVLVRRAIAYGIDREAIVRDLDARGSPARVLQSTSFLPTERGYAANWGAYRHRPAQARQLLEQAGCRRGADGFYACAGERLSLRFVTTAGSAIRERTLQLLQAQLREVGIEVVPLFVPAPAFPTFLRRGEFEAALFAWQKVPGLAGNAPYRCGDDFNFTGYCNRLAHRDLDQLERIVLPRRYAAVANQADRKLARDVPVIPLYQTARLVGYRTSVRGLRPNPFGALTWNAEDWWLAP